jgi:hypothetical protein
MNNDYKTRLWDYLWTSLTTSETRIRQHDKMIKILRTCKVILDLGQTGSTLSTGLLAGYNINALTHNTAMVVLTSLSVGLKMVEKISNLDLAIVHHERSSQNYKFLYEFINRALLLKRTEVQLEEQVDTVSNLFETFQQNAPGVWGCIKKNEDTFLRDTIPTAPLSPNESTPLIN